MTNYAVLVYEEKETKMLTAFCVSEDSSVFESTREQILAMEKDPRYTLVSSLSTTNKDIYDKSCVKARLSELVSYTKYYEDYFKNTEFSSEELKKVSLDLCREQEKVLINKVAIEVTACLFNGLDVESELALACYDYRQAHRPKAFRDALN